MNEKSRRATILVNPEARHSIRRFDPEAALEFLGGRGFQVRLAVPASAAQAADAARATAERGDEFLFVVGGDGSLRAVAMGLAGSATALAAVPTGTVNIWARETGLPLDSWEAALECHLSGQVLPVDLGRADGHCFLLMAGVGWDAAVAKRVPSRLKRRLGDIAYILQAAGMLPQLRPSPAHWTIDGEAREGRLAFMVIGNTRLYGGMVQFTKSAYADDGLLDVLALCPGSIVDGARLSMKTLTGRLGGDHHAFESRARSVSIETPGIPVQLDGDFVGETPMEFSIDPGALRVSLPAGPLPAIFSAHESRVSASR